MQQGSDGLPVTQFRRAPGARAIVSRIVRKGEVSVTPNRFEAPTSERTAALPREDTFVVAVSLYEKFDRDLWIDNRRLARMAPSGTGVATFPGFRPGAYACYRSGFHSIEFCFSRTALDEIADDVGVPRIKELHIRPGTAADDSIIRNLGQCLLPAFEQPDQVNRLFIDHVILAVGAHIVQTYGETKVRQRSGRGGLAPWQERRARDYLEAHLDGEISVTLLADACGLSSTHFSRAFRKSIGTSPHQWLMQRRVDRARQLLRDPDIALADVAMTCGFADQSHFTRVFTRLIGISPGQWRRSYRD
jgi:AraC family transcriptional regulator